MVFSNNLLMGASGQAGAAAGYEVDYSCRFNPDDSSYQSHTHAAAGDTQSQTYSVWVKRGNLGGEKYIISSYVDGNNQDFIQFDANDKLRIDVLIAGVNIFNMISTAVFRDPHAWYHIVVAFDMANATQADRIKVWVNNVRITAWDTETLPADNSKTLIYMTSGSITEVGHHNTASRFDGYIAQACGIDGSVLTPSSFGETDDNGVWRPIDVSGLTFGTEGWLLDFAVAPGTGNGAGTDVHLADTTTKTTSGTGDWTGDTGDFSTMVTDIVATGGNTGAVRLSERTFAGDFAVDFVWKGGANPAYFGGFATSEVGTFAPTGSALADVETMTDSIFLHFNAGNAVDARAAGATEATTIFTAASGEHIKFQRSGSTFTIYEDGTLRHTWTATSSADYTVWLGQASSSMDWENFRWTDGSTSFLNHFTDSGLADNDRVADTPTNNWCTWSPIDKDGTTTGTFSNGNLDITGPAPAHRGTVAISGKQYAEFKMTGSSLFAGGRTGFGIISIADDYATGTASNDQATSNGMNLPVGVVWQDGSATATDYTDWAVNETCCIAVDVDAGKGWVRNDGDAWLGSGDPVAGTNPAFTFDTSRIYTWVTWAYNGSDVSETDFGQKGFAFTPPTGYVGTNTTNLAVPAIKDPSAHFQVNLREGDATAGAVAQTGNSQFGTDFLIIKNRDQADSWRYHSRIRTATKYFVTPGSPDAEATEANSVTAFSASDGYTIGTGATGWNDTGESFLDIHFKADGTTGASNASGSITSTVAVNDTAGFSYGTYTGTGSNATIGHGLSAAPDVIWVKNVSAGDPWMVYHSSNTAAPETDYLILNTTGITVDDATVWQDTVPSATVFSIGTHVAVNTSSEIYQFCAFRSITGMSQFGGYTGNAAADGPFILMPFKPALVIIKTNSIAARNWHSFDIHRNSGNVTNLNFYLDLVNGEGVDHIIDLVSNGIKCRDNSNGTNGSGTYVYMAWAENPFGGHGGTFGGGVAPATAR